MNDKDTQNDSTKSTPFEKFITVMIIMMAATGLVMYCRYLDKSISETVKRKREKSATETKMSPKSKIRNTKVFSFNDSRVR